MLELEHPISQPKPNKHHHVPLEWDTYLAAHRGKLGLEKFVCDWCLVIRNFVSTEELQEDMSAIRSDISDSHRTEIGSRFGSLGGERSMELEA